jgi:myo-inositol-1(or 4)-monophosphatase
MDGLLAQKEESLDGLTLLAVEAALLAGDILRQGYGTQFTIGNKEGHFNLVTEYDHKAEAAVIDFLSAHCPESTFLAEESGSSGTGDLVWVIDPLDGTVNFAREVPIFAVSIGLERRGELIAGVVFQPVTQELFIAEKGKGAFLNGKPLRVSGAKTVQQAILATGFPYNIRENPFHCIEHFNDILKEGIPIRRLGSAAIDFAYTAAGRYEGYFEVSLAPWDCAAGVLLVEEAGGVVTHWDGSPFAIRSQRPVVATNGILHQELLAILSKGTP